MTVVVPVVSLAGILPEKKILAGGPNPDMLGIVIPSLGPNLWNPLFRLRNDVCELLICLAEEDSSPSLAESSSDMLAVIHDERICFPWASSSLVENLKNRTTQKDLLAPSLWPPDYLRCTAHLCFLFLCFFLSAS